jgi:hypothetical protein
MAFRSRAAPLFLFSVIVSKSRIEASQQESLSEKLHGPSVKRTSTPV